MGNKGPMVEKNLKAVEEVYKLAGGKK